VSVTATEVATQSQETQGKENLRLRLARLYVKRGWPVFPVHAPIHGRCSCHRQACPNIGKHPWTEHGHRDATTDEAQLKVWWEEECSWANVGIRTGRESGLVVLDIDPRHGGLSGVGFYP
jgi:hypothetical protein